MTYQFGPHKESFAFNSEFDNGEHSPINAFTWPDEVAFEMGQARRKRAGTDCGRSGAPAALVTQSGGRCIGPTPPICPAVAGILSVQGIGNIPFEYVAKVALDNSTRLMAVTQRLRPRTQRFLPSVQRALTQFVDNMNRFSMPIEAILTAGSYCCRCISRTNSLSNHSFADAFDLVGVRWSGGRETIVHNWRNPAERALLRRVNACLRLSFATVIDYHRTDHRDHFHCDMNRGNPRNTRRSDTLRFTQEALSLVLRRAIPVTGRFDQATQRALIEFGGTNVDALNNSAQLNQILERLFDAVAGPPARVISGEGELSISGTPAAPARATSAGGVRAWRARYFPLREFESQESEYGAPLNLLSPTELKAVKITSTFETGRTGGFGGLSGNFDGQGLSFGLLNFTIKAGSLIPLLQEFISKHPSRFARAFGNDAARFKEIMFATKPDPKNPKRRIRDVERQMEFVNNRMNAIPREARGNKIIEPWKTYFGRLEIDPEFQKIQVKAVRGALNRARYWCDYFGFKTERGFAFMFDLVSSHGGAWLNAKKFGNKRRELLQKMLAAKKAQVRRETLTELEKMEVIANMIAEVSSEKWREKVRIRKLWFVRGTGKVHGTLYDIKKNFSITDKAPDFGPSQQRPEGAPFEWARIYDLFR